MLKEKLGRAIKQDITINTKFAVLYVCYQLAYMFSSANSLTSVRDLSKWNI